MKQFFIPVLAIALFSCAEEKQSGHGNDTIITADSISKSVDTAAKEIVQSDTARIRETAERIDKSLNTSRIKKKEIDELTSVGGLTGYYTDSSGVPVLFMQHTSGELGETNTSYYLQNDKLILVSQTSYTYAENKPGQFDITKQTLVRRQRTFFTGDSAVVNQDFHKENSVFNDKSSSTPEQLKKDLAEIRKIMAKAK
jgi:hypothetical protein